MRDTASSSSSVLFPLNWGVTPPFAVGVVAGVRGLGVSCFGVEGFGVSRSGVRGGDFMATSVEGGGRSIEGDRERDRLLDLMSGEGEVDLGGVPFGECLAGILSGDGLACRGAMIGLKGDGDLLLLPAGGASSSELSSDAEYSVKEGLVSAPT